MAKENSQKWYRMSLSLNVAAHAFSLFMKPEFRGPKFKLDTVEDIIVSQIETQMFMHAINKKHTAEMTEWALEFYRRHLKEFIVV